MASASSSNFNISCFHTNGKLLMRSARSNAVGDGVVHGDDGKDMSAGDHCVDGVIGAGGVQGTRSPMAMSVSGRCKTPFNGCARTARIEQENHEAKTYKRLSCFANL